MYYNHVRPDLKKVNIKQVNEDGTRYYLTEDGSKYPSVTTVLSEYSRQGIAEWRAKVGAEAANKKTAAASGRGTRIHKYCEDYINNLDPNIKNPFDFEMFTSMMPALHRIQNVHAQEHGMYSNYLRMAGTVDCIGEFDGRLSIIDFKTASKPKKQDWIQNYFMQCTAYAIMYEELYQTPIDKIVVIIGVDNEEPQVFVEKRDNWVEQLIKYRDLHEKGKISVAEIL